MVSAVPRPSRPGPDRVEGGLLAGHLPALDGLRAVAIAGVLSQHAGFSRLLGAAQGVTVFFVVSGFLITTLLLDEHDRSGRIALAAFYRRRFARLMPAFALALAVTTTYLLASGVPFSSFWPGPVLSTLYVVNVAGAFGLLGTTAWDYFVHNWSLAIEEQFYFAWPTVLVTALGRRNGRRLLAWLCVGVVAGAHATRLVLTARGAPFERINFATETRIDAVMIGCLLALALAGPGVRAWVRRRSAPLFWTAVAVLVLVTVQGAVVRLDPGGYLAIGIASAAVVAVVAAAPASWPARVLAARPLAWAGRLSYGLYLWNVLLVEVYLRVAHARPVHAWYGVVWLVASFATAQLSYSLVEVPLRRRLRGRSRPRSVRLAPARPVPAPR